MASMKYSIFLPVCSVLLVGCVIVPESAIESRKMKAQPTELQRTSAMISAPKDKVWPLLVSEIGLNYPVETIEKESGLLCTKTLQIPGGYEYGKDRYFLRPKGYGWLCLWSESRMNLRIMAVESMPGKTTVTINAHYEAFEYNTYKSWIPMSSTGTIENQILTSIEQKLGQESGR